MSDKILETEAVLGDVNIAELPLYFLPLDTDVLSLELEESFGDLHLVSIFSLCAFMSIYGEHMLIYPIAQRSDLSLPSGPRVNATAATPWAIPTAHWQGR